jgi:hypothetical protein
LTLLRRKGFHDAASWLLSGSVKFERNCNSRILPPWLPMTTKMGDSLDTDMLFHVLTTGDSYLTDYVKSADRSIAATLPRRSDPSVYLASDLADALFDSGRVRDAIDVLDFAGAQSDDSRLFQLGLLATDDQTKVTGMLSSISGSGATEPSAPSAFAALFASLKTGNSRRPEMNKSEIDKWMRHIAPSFQRIQQSRRSRALLLESSVLDALASKAGPNHDKAWSSQCNESKHIW